jgi:dTDP-glucose 4,6-dehydratase
MKVLITGAAGFIGSHLCELFVKKGSAVRAFVRYTSDNRRGWLDSSINKNDIEVIAGDIRDYDSVKGAMQGVDYVFHLAALIGIPYSYVSPLAYIKTNIEGTYNILQAARELKIQKVIHTSTSEVYGSAQYVPIDEKHPINPQSPYAASKSAADQLALSFFRSFNLPVAIVRPFNTYGPRQSFRAVIPTIISQLLFEAGVKLGNLSALRDMNFVEDTCEGFYQVGLHKNSIGEIINIGSGREISIKELAMLISGISKKPLNIETDEQRLRPKESEVERLQCSSKKALELTGWKTKYTLEEGLAKTIEWFSKQGDKGKTSTYTV